MLAGAPRNLTEIRGLKITEIVKNNTADTRKMFKPFRFSFAGGRPRARGRSVI